MTPHARRRLLSTIGLAAGALALAILPFLPAGWDIYVHVLWPQQVARCLTEGELPLWLPDLNAGFGSPGIRLYSPGGPVLVGMAGAILGNVGRALRLAWFVSLAALFLVARRWHPEVKKPWALVWCASPVVPFLLFHRAASSELLALPLSLWLLEAAIRDENSPKLEAVLWAALWLIHAPSFAMTAVLVTLASTGFKPFPERTFHRLVPVALGLGLVAWHWLPLYAEAKLVPFKEGLTEGIYVATKNFLFAPDPHNSAAVRRLEVLAIFWAAAAVLAWKHQRRRAALTLATILLATPLSYPIWIAFRPLEFLQFPWRLLTPASLLLAGLIPSLGTWKKTAALALFLLPHLWMPSPAVARDPGFNGREEWVELGQKIFRAFGGNPLVVDVDEHRGPAYTHLAENLARFGRQERILVNGWTQVMEWKPLARRIVVNSLDPGLVWFRLLAYPFWSARVDGQPVAPRFAEGVLAVAVPQGRHEVAVEWAGNPLTPWGWVIALGCLAALGWRPRTGKS